VLVLELVDEDDEEVEEDDDEAGVMPSGRFPEG
jgi:hypothetical protein